MADDHPQLGKSIEHAARDDGQKVHAALDCESVDRAVEAPFEEWANHLARRCVRMDVDGHVQGLRGFKDRPEFLVVEKFAACVRVDDRTLEAKPLYGALKFLG